MCKFISCITYNITNLFHFIPFFLKKKKVRDTCYQILKMDQRWQIDNMWQYLGIMTNVFRLWLGKVIY